MQLFHITRNLEVAVLEQQFRNVFKVLLFYHQNFVLFCFVGTYASWSQDSCYSSNHHGYIHRKDIVSWSERQKRTHCRGISLFIREKKIYLKNPSPPQHPSPQILLQKTDLTFKKKTSCFVNSVLQGDTLPVINIHRQDVNGTWDSRDSRNLLLSRVLWQTPYMTWAWIDKYNNYRTNDLITISKRTQEATLGYIKENVCQFLKSLELSKVRYFSSSQFILPL